jgi:hypothetical protein
MVQGVLMRWLLTILLLGHSLFAANSFVQKCLSTGSGPTSACTLAGAVTAGHLITAGVVADSGPVTLNSVQDQAGNAYTILGPCTNGSGEAWVAYRANVPGTGASTTVITATFSASTIGHSIWVRDFGGIATTSPVDVSATASCTGTAGTVINLPTLTPTITGDLLYAVTYDAGAVTATGGSWAATDSNIQNGEADEYILTGTTSATAVNWATSAGAWAAVEVAFKTAPSNVPVPCAFKGKAGFKGKMGCK